MFEWDFAFASFLVSITTTEFFFFHNSKLKKCQLGCDKGTEIVLATMHVDATMIESPSYDFSYARRATRELTDFSVQASHSKFYQRAMPVGLPTMKLKIPEKSIFEIRNQNFCYIQVIVFDLKLSTNIKRCFSQCFHGIVLAKSQPLPLVDS